MRHLKSVVFSEKSRVEKRVTVTVGDTPLTSQRKGEVMNLSKRELRLVLSAIDDATRDRNAFIAAHADPVTGRLFSGYAGLVRSERRRIAAYARLDKKIRDALSSTPS